jgi:hypothetical protein
LKIFAKVRETKSYISDGNVALSIRELSEEAIVRKMSMAVNNPTRIWKAIEKYYGLGFFNEVI